MRLPKNVLVMLCVLPITLATDCDPIDVQTICGDGLVMPGDLCFPLPAYETNGYPYGVAVADFDEDGTNDIVAATVKGETLRIFWGAASDEPTGSFMSLATQDGGWPVEVVATDLEPDGHVDLVARVEVASNDVQTWLGDGVGGFQQMAPVADACSKALTVDDVSGDGALDLVLGAGCFVGDYGLYTHLGNGDGTFGGEQVTLTGGLINSLAVGDLNGDGLADALVPEGYDSLGWRPGSASGTFGASNTIDTGNYWPVALGHLNQDGHLDLASKKSTYSGTFLLTALGTGTGFGSAASQDVAFVEPNGAIRSIVIEDLDGLGNAEVVLSHRGSTSNQLWVFGSGLTPTVPDPVQVFGGEPCEVAGGDFDGDGYGDLVVSHGPCDPLAIGTGTGFVALVQGSPQGLRGWTRSLGEVSGTGRASFGSVNSDVYLDVVVTRFFEQEVVIGLGDGMGGFTTETVSVTGEPMVVAMGNFDGTAGGDVAFVRPNEDSVGILLSQAGSGWQAEQTPIVSGAPRDLAACDLDADGRTDLLVTDVDGDRVAVLLGQLGAIPTQSGHVDLPGRPTQILCEDADGDGDPDLLVGTSQVGALVFASGNGDGSFAGPVVTATSTVSGLATGDLDSDGHLDVVATYAGTPKIEVLEGDGLGSFTVVSSKWSYSPQTPVVADFDADGVLDVLHQKKSGLLQFHRGDGTGQLDDARLAVAPETSAGDLHVADVDGDGAPDLYMAGRGQVFLLLQHP
jgi:hypothetical protein